MSEIYKANLNTCRVLGYTLSYTKTRLGLPSGEHCLPFIQCCTKLRYRLHFFLSV